MGEGGVSVTVVVFRVSCVGWRPFKPYFAGESRFSATNWCDKQPSVRQIAISATDSHRSGDDKVDISLDEPSSEAPCRLACGAQTAG